MLPHTITGHRYFSDRAQRASAANIAGFPRRHSPRGKYSRFRLRALRQRSKRDDRLAVKTGKRIELDALFVRFAAQHGNSAERALSNGRLSLSRHHAMAGCDGRLLSERRLE